MPIWRFRPAAGAIATGGFAGLPQAPGIGFDERAELAAIFRDRSEITGGTAR